METLIPQLATAIFGALAALAAVSFKITPLQVRVANLEKSRDTDQREFEGIRKEIVGLREDVARLTAVLEVWLKLTERKVSDGQVG